MKIDLSGKTALDRRHRLCHRTGLAKAGAHTVLNCRDNARTEASFAKLKGEAPDADVLGVAGDVGTAKGCNSIVAALPAVDILVNNAGIFGPQDFFETPDAELERFFAVNVMSRVQLSRAYLPGMKDKGWGRVFFLSSESGLNIPADRIHYGVTKTADLALSRGLAKRRPERA